MPVTGGPSAGCCASARRSRSRSCTRRCVVIAIYAFNTTRVQRWPPDGLHAEWFDKALAQPGRARRAVDVGRRSASARRRSRCVLGTLAAYALARFDFFGRIGDLVPGHPADRAAGDRHRHGAQRDLHAGAQGRPRAVDDRRRPRDVLRRRWSSTTSSPACGARRRRSRRPPPTSAPRPRRAFRDITFPQMRSALIAGALLAFALSLRRGHRHDVHGGRRRDAADLDPRQPLAAAEPRRSSTSSP